MGRIKRVWMLLAVGLVLLMPAPGCGVTQEEQAEERTVTQAGQAEEQVEMQAGQAEEQTVTQAGQAEERTQEQTVTQAGQAEEQAGSASESQTEQKCFYETADGETYEVQCRYHMMDYQVYPTFDELEQAADLIVTGKFVDDAVREETNWIDRWENTFQITQVLKGDMDLREIRICQFYGIDEEKRVITAASRLTPMEKDSEWIYFLNPGSDKEGCYRVTGTDSGRFPYRKLDFDKLKNGEYTNRELGFFETEEFFFRDDETGEFWGAYKVYLDMVEKYRLAF